MTRTMYDAINAGSLPAGGDLYAGYVDGNWPDAPAIAARFPGETVVSITVNPNDNQGVVGDGPPDNGAWDEWVNWVLKRRAAGVDPTINTNVSNWQAGKAAFTAAGVAEPHWWVAHYDNDPAIPAGAVAKQYASNNLYDTSSVADYWPGVDPAPTTPAPSEEDDLSTQAVNGQVDISWPTGSKHIVQVSYDLAGLNEGQAPVLRAVLLLDSGPLVLSSEWKVLPTGRTINFTDHLANAYGLTLEAVSGGQHYAAVVV